MNIDNPNAEVFKLVNATTGATETLDWEAYGSFEMTMDEACTFSDSNLPTGDKTNNMTLILTGDFVATFPSYYEFGGDTYDGTVENLIACECVDGDGASERVVCTISNLT